MVIQINKEVYNALSDSEKQVINYLNKNEDTIPMLSITTIAKRTHTSTATVSRTIQKCGFKGISELRYLINSKNRTTNQDPYEVNRILSKSYQECTKTIDNICVADILEIINYIKSARKIFIYARGFTVLVAEEFCMHLQLLEYNIMVVKDVTWMVKTDKIVTDKDLVIILSVLNTTPELAQSAKMAHNVGAKVVTCCCKSGTVLEKYSDINVIGVAEDITNNRSITVTSRIPLYIICRTITEYLSL